MRGEEIVRTDEFRRCLEFHGHLCPGLSLGYRAAKAGLDWLKENRAEDEDLVAIVENDACGCDAVQVLTGCTFGKGNLIFRDYGKQVFTFLARKSGKAVRVSLRPDAWSSTAKGKAGEWTREGESRDMDEGERKRFYEQMSYELLERPVEELFRVEPAHVDFPPRARIYSSEPCGGCGEPTMVTRLKEAGGRRLCRECLQRNEGS